MKKKTRIIISLLMVLVMASVLGGCGSSKPASDEGTEPEVERISDTGEAPFSDESLDMEGCLLRINTDGMGQIARAEQGRTLAFDEEFPTQSSADNLKEGTSVVIEAKPDEGWKFVKWTMNGEDYSTDEQFTYTVTEDVEFKAVFESAE